MDKNLKSFKNRKHKPAICHPERFDYIKGLCIPCYSKTQEEYRKKYQKEYREKNKEEVNEYYRNYYVNNPEYYKKVAEKRKVNELLLKKKIMDAYGGCCSCCGEKEIVFF